MSLKLFKGASFSKPERLCDKNIIASLFEAGQSFLYPPFTILYIQTPLDSQFPAQIMITVSKKKFDKSVDRNHIKRLVREAYRKNKIPLYEFLHTNKFQLAIGFIYSSKKITTFNHIENKIKVALSELIDKISDNNIKSV